MIRYDDRLDLQFHKDIKNENQKIAPLILLSMVENAFKHGASGDPDHPQIHIDLLVDDKEIYFKVFNTKPPKIQLDRTGYKKGIGVNNIKRQLELIYGDIHTLDIKDKSDSYEIALSIQRTKDRVQQKEFTSQSRYA